MHVFAQKFVTLWAVNILPFEAIRGEMEKNIEGDEYLDYSDETLVPWQILELFH